ncbi:hypothetical protein IV203_028160 [Nitzschia inconspicua]|uniref:Uncharacterized protein n=1 Tax=Nitzschia inconspicua TaxID=303405 RepID=A0A9K3KKV7_9STRA|nr:hypothetical protein IV203_028184 [Nitzschia inconspicua]KAG7336874.1 hypothetical protein IV203_033472 [Nitzschia inconspicua]KAG7337023.1 hypothetical protein IV203_022787 [Nitzschia inconspicua]KAG7344688.1 hypothetical protein IV203_032219 [Nitzschia inconspicua]KAG7370414.1 hypothetical protein IV203_028160 [Nitzschia inconspicua]
MLRQQQNRRRQQRRSNSSNGFSSGICLLVMMTTTLLLLYVQFTLAQTQSAQPKLDLDPRASRQGIIENHNRRREQLRKLLEETKEKVDAHEHGRSLLQGDEYDTLKKRIGLFEKKLEKMEGPMNDREIDKILERQKIRQERIRHTEL